jgi:preprotein translocase subunit SecG
MYTLLIVLFFIICIFLTFVILIQSSKGGGLAGGAFGGVDSMGTMLGGRGSASFLSKVTAILAAAFMIIALLLGFLTRGSVSQSSLVEQSRERRAASPAKSLPQTPAPVAPVQPQK